MQNKERYRNRKRSFEKIKWRRTSIRNGPKTNKWICDHSHIKTTRNGQKTISTIRRDHELTRITNNVTNIWSIIL